MKKKTIAALIAFVLLIGAGVGVTLAYLTDRTQEVTNTFTVGKVDIDLWEHKLNTDGKTVGSDKVISNNGYKIVPGGNAEKDPTVEVIKGSEACYVFIKITETNNDVSDKNYKYVTYEIAQGWNPLNDVPGVYYQEVASLVGASGNTVLKVLKNDKVTYSADLTNAELKTAQTSVPTLKFTAYAVQKDNVTDVDAAWAAVEDLALADVFETNTTTPGTTTTP